MIEGARFLQCLNRSGIRADMDVGEYVVCYRPSLFLMAHASLPLSHLEAFLRDMLGIENGYIEKRPGECPLPIHRMGRLGHCVSEYIEGECVAPCYFVADSAVGAEEMPTSDQILRVSSKRLLSFAEGRGAVTPTESEYQYAVTGGRQILFSTGYEVDVYGVDAVLKELRAIWPPRNVAPVSRPAAPAAPPPTSPAPTHAPAPAPAPSSATTSSASPSGPSSPSVAGLYCVEVARAGRAKCANKPCSKKIEKGVLRVGMCVCVFVCVLGDTCMWEACMTESE